MNKINYQKELEKVLADIEGRGFVPTLAMHVCCAPCSSYCLEYLTKYFDITCIYYNPNISPKEEFDKRVNELRRLSNEMPFCHTVNIVEGKYDNDRFNEIVKGLEKEPEGGKRCHKCYRMRMEESAKYAKENNFDFFTTTLSISPLKDSQVLNQIGKELSDIYDIPYLYSDFKKKGGYLRSIELSREYDLYRQNFCGCVYSRRKE
ncbi:MAG: epoxyqueuosine reductase QueH [Lachnospiraceae bacterium]|nr:epoxyqueuosine reductase QueH [Lachnospiraceae bacterium]